jgi:C4-dicarboxylate transporter DctQ subunit
MKSFWRLFDRAIEAMAILAGLILVLVTGAVCYTIFLRYLFHKTTIWIAQTTEYALLWIVFLAATWLLREGGHITTDILHSRLQEKHRRALDTLTHSVAGLAAGIMVLFGAWHVLDCLSNHVTDVRAVTVPKGAVFAIIPVGSLFLAFQFFRLAWNSFLAARNRR